MQFEESKIASNLVSRILQGDRSAESELVERYSRGLLLLLRKRCGDVMLAEDLHQKCMEKVLIRLRDRGLDEPAKLACYIHRTAIYLFIGHVRKEQGHKTYCDSEGLERVVDTSHDPEASVHDDQVASLIRRWLGELRTDRDCKLLARFYLLQEDKERICSELNLSPTHFNRVLFRARGRFRQLLEQGDRRRHLRVVR